VRLHHVAIAVESLASARAVYEGAFGMSASKIEFVPGQKVNVMVLYAGTQRVELVEPVGEDSPIKNFLAKRGPGIHHLAWEVESCEQAIARLKAAGVALIDEVPKPGAHGTRIAFVHPKATGGVLMELVEDPHGR
jgi:methylmalonyl-CoA/ethylmalonyl-CoA epimerase